ncbi:MAG: Re/Si-specific NAD(P)(+) transhydrogenase subunit alpha [Gemmatimonadota bacterium]
MRIAVVRETAPRERRVALVPASVKKLIGQGHQVAVETGAGVEASFPDDQYVEAGATIAGSGAQALAGADLVVKVQRPTTAEFEPLASGTVLAGLLQPQASSELLRELSSRGVIALAMELVPRTTKAQSMDVLSSQATVAGYQAVLLGASRMGRFLPMLTTAAGTITPAKCFVIGAGVAGLQAIATARRLGGLVSAFDVRPIVKEQVESLGARFVDAEAVSTAAEGSGGYAKELADEQQARVLAAIGTHIRDMDLVIATAAIPGKPAPRLITTPMLHSMRVGSVIVDVAAESGGNCEVTKPGDTVTVAGVTVIGPLNLASTLPRDASVMYSNNMLALIQHAAKEGRFAVDQNDPIVGPMWANAPAPAATAGV